MQTSDLSTVSDLETPCSRPTFATTTNHFAIELKDHSISNIISEREQQLDLAPDKISDLQTVINSIGALR